jgi:hypothetical protein
MRYALLVLGLFGCIGLWQGWFAQAYDHATTAALTDDARLAIDLRCEREQGPSEHECRTVLKKLYLSGSLDPVTTLRTYCDSVKHARWGGSRPSPPEICIERFGGWREG